MSAVLSPQGKAKRSISDARTKQLSPQPGSHVVSTHTKLQFVDQMEFFSKNIISCYNKMFNFNKKTLEA